MSAILPESNDGRRARTIERPGVPGRPGNSAYPLSWVPGAVPYCPDRDVFTEDTLELIDSLALLDRVRPEAHIASVARALARTWGTKGGGQP